MEDLNHLPNTNLVGDFCNPAQNLLYPNLQISEYCTSLQALYMYFYFTTLKPTWRSKAVVWRKPVTNIVDERKYKLHDVLRCRLTVIQFHTPERREKKIIYCLTVYHYLGRKNESITLVRKMIIHEVPLFMRASALLRGLGKMRDIVSIKSTLGYYQSSSSRWLTIILWHHLVACKCKHMHYVQTCR